VVCLQDTQTIKAKYSESNLEGINVLSEERKTAIIQILIHRRGKANAINSKQIATQLNIPDNDTYGATRKLIKKIIETENLPIGAYRKGFFIMETQEELNEEIIKLNKRITGIKNRAEKVRTNYKQFHGGKQVLLVHDK
jgi:hypothetical protein